MTITLIGMPGSGKTCMGRMLSKKLQMKVVDGDKLIETVYGMKLHEIIEKEGLDGFKKIEEETLLSIEEDNIIITPGGSAVYYDSVMRKFKERGAVVYLYTSPETIIERLGDFSKRGVVLEEGKTLHDLYAERAPLFERYADITINCDGNAFARYRYVTCNEVTKYIRKHSKSVEDNCASGKTTNN